MKKLITLGLLVATVAFGGAAFAGDGGTVQDRELQQLFEASTKVSTPMSAAAVQEYRGSTTK